MEKVNTLGARLRSLRAERNISQRALAQLADISSNSISLIERGEISPSVATMQNLATALNVRMSYFFEEESAQKVLHVKAPMRPRLHSRGVMIENIGGRLQGQEIEPFLIKLAPNTSSGEHQVSHNGHELVYCLQGKLAYNIDGQRYLIEAGDFLIFEARLPHLWCNPFDLPAEFLLILQTSGATLEPVKRHFIDYPSVSHIK